MPAPGAGFHDPPRRGELLLEPVRARLLATDAEGNAQPMRGPFRDDRFIALVIAVILIDVPMSLHEPSASLYYLFIGVMFNTVRFLFLGIVIGYLYKPQQKTAVHIKAAKVSPKTD